MSEDNMREAEKTAIALIERERLIKDYFILIKKPN